MASVGTGTEVGIHPESTWSNPELEVVLVVSSTGKILGATLGNDVNLRVFEGRSALLLGKAKDNNASAALGPFIRLFDATFNVDDVRQMDLSMQVVHTCPRMDFRSWHINEKPFQPQPALGPIC